jgi:hypothetical protein
LVLNAIVAHGKLDRDGALLLPGVFRLLPEIPPGAKSVDVRLEVGEPAIGFALSGPEIRFAQEPVFSTPHVGAMSTNS